MHKLYSLIILTLLCSDVASGALYQVGGFDPVRADPATWTCYDTAIAYARENPEWGVVSMSSNPVFRGVSHMVNYRIDADGSLILRDESNGFVMTQVFADEQFARECNDQFEPAYYHFWQQNETALRNYRQLKDNLNEYYGVKVA